MKNLPNEIHITGKGRVGSYEAAKKAGRCRARKYWTLCEFDSSKVRPEDPYSPLVGYVEIAGAPRFKTMKTAQEHLKSLGYSQRGFSCYTWTKNEEPMETKRDKVLAAAQEVLNKVELLQFENEKEVPPEKDLQTAEYLLVLQAISDIRTALTNLYFAVK